MIIISILIHFDRDLSAVYVINRILVVAARGKKKPNRETKAYWFPETTAATKANNAKCVLRSVGHLSKRENTERVHRRIRH